MPSQTHTEVCFTNFLDISQFNQLTVKVNHHSGYEFMCYGSYSLVKKNRDRHATDVSIVSPHKPVEGVSLSHTQKMLVNTKMLLLLFSSSIFYTKAKIPGSSTESPRVVSGSKTARANKQVSTPCASVMGSTRWQPEALEGSTCPTHAPSPSVSVTELSKVICSSNLQA